MDNQNRQRVTGCIYDRFAVMFDTDNEGTPEQRDNFAYNCALALDFIGAGKIARGEAYDLMLRALNNDFKDTAEIVDYIAHIRAPKKKKEYSHETKARRDAKALLKRGGYTTAQIAYFVGLSEGEVNDIAKAIK